MPEEPEEEYIACRHTTPKYDFLITYPSDLLEESSVYQDILQKGERRGVKQGAKQEARKVALRLLERRFGKLPPEVRRQIGRLAITQLEKL